MIPPIPQYEDFDDNSFSIFQKFPQNLIDSIPERDDQCEFERNMYNFGEQEDLPDSDRAMDLRCKNS